MNYDRLYRSHEPSQIAITQADVREHLMISDQSQDRYIMSLIDAATAMIDGPHGIGIALMTQSYELALDELPAGSFKLPIYPIRSVASISWTDSAGQPHVETNLRIVRQTGSVYHSLQNIDAQPGSIIVSFTAGHDIIPADLRHALLMLVGHLYENREATATVKLEKVPLAVETILNRYRVT